MIILIRFESNLKMYIETARYSQQTHVHSKKLPILHCVFRFINVMVIDCLIISVIPAIYIYMLVLNLVVSIYIFKFILNSTNIIVSVHNGAIDDFKIFRIIRVRYS